MGLAVIVINLTRLFVRELTRDRDGDVNRQE